MTTTMPKWASRALALTILLVILWLVFVLAVNPIVSAYRTTGDELDRTVEQLARYQNVSKAYPKLKQQMDVLSRRHAASGVYLAGTTDALAAAELQEDVGRPSRPTAVPCAASRSCRPRQTGSSARSRCGCS